MRDSLKLACLALAFAAHSSAQSFEVASLKPSPPDAPTAWKGGPGTTDPGLFTCTHQPLSILILNAFHLNPYQLAPLNDSSTYQISAKVPAGTTHQEFDRMLQQLLIDRFKLAHHFEKKELQVYDLVIAKEGLKMRESPPLDPAATGESPAPKTPRPGSLSVDEDGFLKVPRPSRQSYSMSAQDGLMRWEFRDANLPQIASMIGAHLEAPVFDLTALTSTYDFTLSWAADAVAGPAAPTLVQAVHDQLGLSLVRTKRIVDILIIDHAEKTPIPN